MHSAVRRYRVSDADTLVSRVEEEFVPIVSGVDGYVGYYVVDGGDGTMVSITVAQSASGVEESNRLAADWVRDNASDLIEERLESVQGEVRVSHPPNQ